MLTRTDEISVVLSSESRYQRKRQAICLDGRDVLILTIWLEHLMGLNNKAFK